MKNLIFTLIFSALLTSCGEFGKEPEKGIGLRMYQSSKFPEINYDGVSDRYYSQEMNNVYTKEPYMYIYISQIDYLKTTTWIQVIFQITMVHYL